MPEDQGQAQSSVPMLPARAERDAQSSVVLSIIIVSWNTREALKECLRSIYACDGEASEVIVVDNASQDDSISMVEREFPEVTLIRNTRNAGFARASNQGILSSQGDYVLLLNSDAQVREQALAHMIQFVEEHPQAGAVGPRLVLPDGRPQPYSFGCDPTIGYLLRRGLNLLRGKGYLHDWATADIGEVDWVSGASLMLRRQALEDTGLLDENFFLYFEDNDLCLRLRQRGWRVYFCPAVNVVHLGGQSLMKNDAARDEYYHSLAHFYRKHYGNLTIALALLLPVYRLLLEFRGRGGGHPSQVGC